MEQSQEYRNEVIPPRGSMKISMEAGITHGWERFVGSVGLSIGIDHLATDHAGLELKNSIKAYLIKKGHNVTDHGAHEYDALDDYPDFIFPCAKAVAADSESRGIILGGSGQGEAIAANRIKGERAAVFYNGPEEIVKLSREHNNANILSLEAF